MWLAFMVCRVKLLDSMKCKKNFIIRGPVRGIFPDVLETDNLVRVDDEGCRPGDIFTIMPIRMAGPIGVDDLEIRIGQKGKGKTPLLVEVRGVLDGIRADRRDGGVLGEKLGIILF